MLESLTPEQEAKMLEVRDYWKDYFFSCRNKVNKPEAEKFVKFIYELSSLTMPEIIYADSPMHCQKIVNELKKNETLTFESFSSYGNVSDYGWVSFYDFFTQIGVLNDEKFNTYKELLLSSSVYDMIQLTNYCIISNMPDRIERDDQGRLHCENNSAIHFIDGYEQFYWHGVYVKKDWIMNPDSITKETFMNEKNAELRRYIQEIIGNKKLIEMIGVEIIDEDIESSAPNANETPQNFPIKLYRTIVKDVLIDDYIYFLNVIDPSTKREYYLCVPEAKNVWEAKQWTFLNKKIEIRHGDVALFNLSTSYDTPLYQS